MAHEAPCGSPVRQGETGRGAWNCGPGQVRTAGGAGVRLSSRRRRSRLSVTGTIPPQNSQTGPANVWVYRYVKDCPSFSGVRPSRSGNPTRCLGFRPPPPPAARRHRPLRSPLAARRPRPCRPRLRAAHPDNIGPQRGGPDLGEVGGEPAAVRAARRLAPLLAGPLLAGALLAGALLAGPGPGPGPGPGAFVAGSAGRG